MYSNSSNGSGFNASPTNKKYIGVAVSDSSIPPTLANKYNWTLIKGTDGVKGEKGSDGESRYLHIKYSNNGTSFTSNNGETLGSWIGMYVDAIEGDSDVFSDYKWRKVDGEDGKDGKDGIKGLTGPAPVFTGPYDSKKGYYGTLVRSDIVEYAGTYYIAKFHHKDNAFVGHPPTDSTY